MMNNGWMRIIVCAAVFAGASCGAEDDESVSPSGPVSGGPPLVLESDAGLSAPPSPVTCDTACTRAVELCGESLGSVADCLSVCDSIPRTTRNCMAGAAVCDDVMQCADQEEASPDDSDTSGELGDECFSGSDCGSGFCRTPPGAEAGQCGQNDFGATCTSSDDCSQGLCLFRAGTADSSGICSATCESFVDCPTFWECTQLSDGAATVCWNN